MNAMKELLVGQARRQYENAIAKCDELFDEVEALMDSGFFVSARGVHNEWREAYAQKLRLHAMLRQA